MGIRPFLTSLFPRKLAAFFAFGPLVLSDLFFDKVGDPVKWIGVHHGRDRHVFFNLQNFAHLSSIDHNLSCIVKPRPPVTEVKSKPAASARLPDFVEPMKAKLVDAMPSGNWIYEIKFDGYRAVALRGGNETRILSRNQKDLGGKFSEVKDSIAALDVQDAVIDGEIVALDEKGRSSFHYCKDSAWERSGHQ